MKIRVVVDYRDKLLLICREEISAYSDKGDALKLLERVAPINGDAVFVRL